jgi:hypothetical protein
MNSEVILEISELYNNIINQKSSPYKKIIFLNGKLYKDICDLCINRLESVTSSCNCSSLQFIEKHYYRLCKNNKNDQSFENNLKVLIKFDQLSEEDR